jgi:hypothetical protein
VGCYGTHTDVAAQILQRSFDLGAGAIVLGPEGRHGTPTTDVNAYIAAHAPGHVIIINPAAGALGRRSADAPTRRRNALTAGRASTEPSNGLEPVTPRL